MSLAYNSLLGLGCQLQNNAPGHDNHEFVFGGSVSDEP